jgi:hypothetical protein
MMPDNVSALYEYHKRLLAWSYPLFVLTHCGPRRLDFPGPQRREFTWGLNDMEGQIHAMKVKKFQERGAVAI